MIDEHGNVFPCELINKPVGNLRDAGYDFSKIWSSPELAESRSRIAEQGCSCTCETNVSTNFYFNLSSYPLMAYKMLFPNGR